MLAFEFPDPSELGDFQATVFALPVVEGRLTDPVGPAYIGHLHSGIGFLEDCHDLALRESALFHWFLGCFPSPFLYFQPVPREGKLTLGNALLEDVEYNDLGNADVSLALFCLADELGVTDAKKAAYKLKRKFGVTMQNTLIRLMLFSLRTVWKKRSFDKASKEGTTVTLLGLEQEEETTTV